MFRLNISSFISPYSCLYLFYPLDEINRPKKSLPLPTKLIFSALSQQAEKIAAATNEVNFFGPESTGRKNRCRYQRS